MGKIRRLGGSRSSEGIVRPMGFREMPGSKVIVHLNNEVPHHNFTESQFKKVTSRQLFGALRNGLIEKSGVPLKHFEKQIQSFNEKQVKEATEKYGLPMAFLSETQMRKFSPYSERIIPILTSEIAKQEAEMDRVAKKLNSEKQ